MSILVSTIVLGCTFFIVLPKFASYSLVADALGSLKLGWLVALALVTIINVGTFGPNWMVVLPGLGYFQAIEVNMAGTAISNVVPLGGALSLPMQYSFFRRWGFENSIVSRAIVLTGVWNNAANLAMPSLGLLLLTIRGEKNAALETAAQIGTFVLIVLSVLFWQVIHSDSGARQVGLIIDRLTRRTLARLNKVVSESFSDKLARFRADSAEFLRERILSLTLTTLAGVLSMYLVLVVALRGLAIGGSQVTLTEAFAAWASTRLLSTAFPVTPGGLGIVDVGLIAALVGFGGHRGPVVAAVLLYRVLTYVPPVVLGAIAMLTTRLHKPKLG